MACICPVIGAGIRRPDVYTKLHLRMNGEGNAFLDLTGKSITVAGNATQIKGSRFIGNAGYFDGNGDYLSVADSDGFTPVHAGKYTWELLVRFNSFNSGKFESLIYHNQDGSNQLHFRTKANGTGVLLYMYSGGTQYTFADITMTLSTGTWYHVVLVKDGTNYKSYINGVLKTNSTQSATIPNFGGVLVFGTYYWNPSTGYDLNGYMSEVRVSNTARYSANFTPPTRRR